jgi:hypothetical protein
MCPHEEVDSLEDIRIEDVSRATWFAATALAVAPEQTAHFSAPIVCWLAESRVEPHFRP